MNATEFDWPPQPASGDAPPCIETAIVIARAPARVFEFVTTAARWHEWHPATVAVREAPDRPLTTGETMVETIAALGRRFYARWTVRACEPPRLWVIATTSADGDARVVYRLSPHEDGTRFERRLEYRSHRWPWCLLDGNLTRWALGRQSARALSNLKRVLEATG